MLDFRLRVFEKVAYRLSFTKAASELHITQPAVSKHIKEIERELNTKLFDRNGNKIQLTESGKILLHYTKQIIGIHRDLEFEIAQLNESVKGHLRLGASSTVAQYVLPPILAQFHARFEEINLSLSIHNTEYIENQLLNNQIDFGIIEGLTKHKNLKYTPFLEDEIVLICRYNHPLQHRTALRIDEITEIPLVLREPGSGTLETILNAFEAHHISYDKLKIEMQLGNTESIKTYLQYSDCFSLLSRHSIQKEVDNQQLRILPIRKMQIKRNFNFIQHIGDQSALVGFFQNFCTPL